MSIDQLLKALLATKASFESALAGIGRVEPVPLFLGLLKALEDKEDLDNTERERRLSAVFKKLQLLDPAGCVAIGEAGANVSNPVLRNALAQLLAPEFRGLVYRRKQTEPQKLEPIATANDLPPAEEETISESSSSEDAACSDVIILSILDSPATARLLEQNGFVPLRCQSIDELDKILASLTEICGFVVESSFLAPLNAAEQATLIEKLACFSSFAWLRFQSDRLLSNDVEVAQQIARARCRVSPDVTEMSFQHHTDLQGRELVFLKNARARLRSGHSHGLFVPGELTKLELSLLGAAMSQYSKKRRFNPGAELTQVTTEFLQGGQTGARVALVKVNDLKVPVIVKVDTKDSILEEARRFLTFIQKENSDLTPEVHLHASAALIVFGIVPGPDSKNEEPAPTLADQLADHWYGEMRDPVGCSNGESLLKGFKVAATRLSNLNRQKCTEKNFRCRANPYIASVKAMEQKGFEWGFDRSVHEARAKAEKCLEEASERAVCHGDAHVRNILIRGDEGFLIDFAYSGPGHPCSDLVRLELSVFLTRFVVLGNDGEIEALQRDFSLKRLPIDELLLKYKTLMTPKINQLCLKMCLIARDLVGDVLQAHGLSWDHYVSVKILSAWQALQVPAVQQFLARSVISAFPSEGLD